MSKSPDAFRTISEVADWLDTPAHVLRFWESKFSQVKPVKRAGGRRYYRPSDMLLLGGIKQLLHHDGLTIKGAQKVLSEKGVKAVSAMSQPIETTSDEAAPEVEDKTVDTPARLPDPVDDIGADTIEEAPFAEMSQPEPNVVPFQRTAEPEPAATAEDDLDDADGEDSLQPDLFDSLAAAPVDDVIEEVEAEEVKSEEPVETVEETAADEKPAVEASEPEADAEPEAAEAVEVPEVAEPVAAAPEPADAIPAPTHGILSVAAKINSLSKTQADGIAPLVAQLQSHMQQQNSSANG